MRLTGILLLATVLHVSAGTSAQTVTYKGHSAPLTEVFKIIERQTGYIFFYPDEYLKDTRPVTIEFEKTPLLKALEKIFDGQPVGFDVREGKMIVLNRVTASSGQRKTALSSEDMVSIHGFVRNEDNEPVPGANIIIMGPTTRGIATNSDGSFSINVRMGDVLKISSIGYQPTEYKITSAVISSFSQQPSQTGLVIVLQKAETSLQQAVVNKGYYTEKARFSVGSVTKVTGEDIAAQPVSNPLQALEGRVPGLTVTQTNGMPGSTINIQIRGQNSLGQTPGITPLDNPLFIIDGVPMAAQNNNINQIESAFGFLSSNNPRLPGIGPFNSLNPSDIESIEVLRGADATAIYGSRGANGVILITTKKGKVGKVSVSGVIWSGESQVTKMTPMMNTKQYLQMRRQTFINDGLTPGADPSSAYTQTYAPDLLFFDTTRYVDWNKIFLGNTAHTTDANISVSGGSQNDQFLMGTGVHHEGNVYPGGFGDNRATVNISFQHNSTDKKFTMSFTANYSYDHNTAAGAPQAQSAFTLAPDYPSLLNPDGSLNWMYNGVDLGNYLMDAQNPMTYIKRPYSITNYHLISSGLIGYQLLPGLTLSSSFGYTTLDANEHAAYPYIAQDPATYHYSYAYWGANEYKTWIIEPKAEYKKQVSQGILNLMIGGTFQQNTNNGSMIRGYDFPNDLLLNSISAAGQTNASGNYSLYRYNAVFGRINYAWDSKYILNLTGRRDGSSRFGPGKQFGDFGSASAGWIFSAEPFMKKAFPWLSFGKIHTSYGTTGNDNIGDYQYLSAYAPILNFSYQGAAGYTPQSLYNSDFRWGLTKELEAALSLNFLKDRIQTEITWYRNRSGNQLVSYQLPDQTGFNSVLQNAPYTVQNTGVEIVLSSANVNTKSFAWNSAFNITFPSNKLLSFPGLAASSYYSQYMLGQSLSVLRLFKMAGIDPKTGIYQFFTSKGVITSNPNGNYVDKGGDKVLAGNQDPRFYGGLRNTINYKGLQLDVFIEFRKQIGLNYIYQTYSQAGSGLVGGLMMNVPAVFATAWQKASDKTDIQKLTSQYGDAYNAVQNFLMSTGAYSDASYIRLKTISLSYTLRHSMAKYIGANTCRFYFTGQNLFTITRYPGIDPETKSLGTLPPLRTFVGGLQLNL